MKLQQSTRIIMASLAAGALILPLASCGAGGNADKIKLSYLSWNNEQASKPFIDEFEKENPDISIDFSYSPPTPEYIQTLQTRLVGNQAPDVFVITSENKADLMNNHYVKDLTDEPFMKNIAQANKDFVTRDGKVYGMSTSSWASGIVYNKDLLKKAGTQEVPKTWDDFLAACAKLKKAGVTPYLETVADGRSRIPDAFTGAKFAKDGTDVTSLASKSRQTPGEDEKQAIKEWMKLYDQNLVTRDTVGMSADDVKTQFVNGQVAMICTGPWDFSTFQQAKGLNWGYAQMPALSSDYEPYSQGSPSPGLAIYSKLSGDRLKAAEKFLAFMSGKWALKQQSRNGDAVTATAFDSKVVGQYEDVYTKNVKTGKYFLMNNFYKKPDVFETATKAETQQLVQGKISADQWAKNVDAKMASAQ
ncbi:raffinose/stachyose/melibiose transport system substrate-binding protein [Bifidobacterium bohemicum]|uniref:ABC transporter, solute-binding protein n=1 Tax=Bifidobacterium bohemicum DSM 22767 TaxID=1437606 RepID=A0A086ZK52_9BIFI|nr:extracellular solute-binding protein [Bifidobacterium bohemicum]KFI46902.1 ABC transporter, solute-binding protein [Bifidobacterium bohemicum DSM 22767]SCB84466.1 raffinose/stachyose/melibiose transport system substrate-binding protein [Bifidobacterium bohemicum]